MLMPMVSPYIPAGSALSGSFIGYTENNSNTTTYTYTNHAIGVADADRFVVVLFQGIRPNSTLARTITSATIGGITATVAVEQDDPVQNHPFCAILYAKVPTGTTATIVVNMSNALLYADVAVYRVVSDSGSLSVTQTLKEVNGSSDTTVLGTLTTAVDGFAVAGSIQLNGSTTTIAGALTEDVENDTSSGEYFSAYSSATTGASLDVTITTADGSIGAGEFIGVAASFEG